MAAAISGTANEEWNVRSKAEKEEQQKKSSFEVFQKLQTNDWEAVGEELLDSGKGETERSVLCEEQVERVMSIR